MEHLADTVMGVVPSPIMMREKTVVVVMEYEKNEYGEDLGDQRRGQMFEEEEEEQTWTHLHFRKQNLRKR